MSDRTPITLRTCAPANCADTARHSPKVATRDDLAVPEPRHVVDD